MKYKILIFVVGILLSPIFVMANTCSPDGYTIITVNGMVTTPKGAIYNSKKVDDTIPSVYNNQEIIVDYVYNATHLAGIGDFADSANQKLFEGLSTGNYDMTNMVNDLSQKVTTQKLLLVAHSQGNFYSNDIYNLIASKPGGVPKKSMGIYGVGSPASYVAGGGKYITSSEDKIINLVRLDGYLDVLPPNVKIVSEKSDDPDGHKLASVYLKYQGKRIASEILTSLHNLKENQEQNPNENCISAPKLTKMHKLIGVFYEIADPASVALKKGIGSLFDMGSYLSNKTESIGNSVGKVFKNLFASAGGVPLENLTTTPTTSVEIDNPSEETKDEVVETPTTEIESEEKIEKILKIIPEATELSEKIELEIQEEDIVEPSIVKEEEVIHKSHGHKEDPTPSPDTTSPVITLIGASSLEIDKGSIYEDAGATAMDDKDGVLEVEVISDVDTSVAGTYTVKYSAMDLSFNISTITRTVNVIIPLESFVIDVNTTLPAGEYFYDNLRITNNAILTLEGDPLSTESFKGVKINANNLVVDVGAKISANGKGYTDGPGTLMSNNSGGSYGGDGERNFPSKTYGSSLAPIDLGSRGAGGSNYYHGGGAIRLAISETLKNDGIISADGMSNSSGGSIYVTTKTITGGGTFSTKGGGFDAQAVIHGCGGGGRIAIYYEESSFVGKAEAKGGCGNYDGWSPTCAGDGTVGFFDTVNNNLTINSSWEFRDGDGPFNFDNIYILNGAKVKIGAGAEINTNSFFVSGASTLTLSGEEIITAEDLTISGNSTVTILPEKILFLEVSNLNIEKGSSIVADSKGYIDGPGSTETSYRFGSSHGGRGGGVMSKPVYGSETAPVDFGSGVEGTDRRGGGAIRLIVSGILKNDGIISVNGTIEHTSGGSIYITTNTLSGTGIFSAKGGNSRWPYGSTGGGGGRIAIHYKSLIFSGTSTVIAGTYCFSGCAPAGERGTIKMIDESFSSEKKVLAFNFEKLIPSVVGVVNETDHTITATVPFGTNVTVLVPTITISPKATIAPTTETVKDFTSPVVYTVTAEDGTTGGYIINVEVAVEETGGDE